MIVIDRLKAYIYYCSLKINYIQRLLGVPSNKMQLFNIIFLLGLSFIISGAIFFYRWHPLIKTMQQLQVVAARDDCIVSVAIINCNQYEARKKLAFFRGFLDVNIEDMLITLMQHAQQNNIADINLSPSKINGYEEQQIVLLSNILGLNCFYLYTIDFNSSVVRAIEFWQANYQANIFMLWLNWTWTKQRQDNNNEEIFNWRGNIYIWGDCYD